MCSLGGAYADAIWGQADVLSLVPRISPPPPHTHTLWLSVWKATVKQTCSEG